MTTEEIGILMCSVAFFVMGFFQIFSGHFNKVLCRKILKVFPLIFLIVGIIIFKPDEPLIYCAFIFGVIGDAFLISDNKKLFFAGLVSFLFQHILIAIFLFTKWPIMPYYYFIILEIVALLFGFIASFVMKKYLNHIFFISSTCYISMLLFNLVNGVILTIFTSNLLFLLIAFGYLIFTISDFFVSIKRFVGTYKHQELIIMSTYYLAQYLLFLGFMLL